MTYLKTFWQCLIPAVSLLAVDCGATARLPVANGVAIDKRGALLVADDVGNTIWRVTGAR